MNIDREIILITGGVKSGKSSWALQCGEKIGSKRAFVATATALDEEMEHKIRAHQKQRGDRWTTFEEPREVAGQVEKIAEQFDVVLVDCLTLWVSNLLTLYNMTEDTIRQESQQLAAVLKKSPSPIIVVSNEVSMGIMPADHVSRRYQTLLANTNRDVAAIAGNVYFMVSGIAQRIK
jgi:adenosylcobinamide kinase/adenosylcobinamide-phosphate guanylyltransferase